MTPCSRSDGRRPEDIRAARIVPNVLKSPAGSVRVEMGDTHVLCTVCVEETVPDFLVGKGSGWVTAEYGMLPGSTNRRKERRVDGRMQEIRRLIGRCLRAAVSRPKLGERTLLVDCDVLQADGGTRTASVTGAWVALALTVRRLKAEGLLDADPMRAQVAAVSVGLVKGEPLLDLSYEEDAGAEVDMNVAMTREGRFVEAQATAEGKTFDADQLSAMLALAASGCQRLFEIQDQALAEA